MYLKNTLQSYSPSAKTFSPSHGLSQQRKSIVHFSTCFIPVASYSPSDISFIRSWIKRWLFYGKNISTAQSLKCKIKNKWAASLGIPKRLEVVAGDLQYHPWINFYKMQDLRRVFFLEKREKIKKSFCLKGWVGKNIKKNNIKKKVFFDIVLW